MPTATQLPDELRSLATVNAIDLGGQFHNDVQRILRTILLSTAPTNPIRRIARSIEAR